jgi:hypothetical protein
MKILSTILKGDAFVVKLDREYSEDFNRVLGQQRIFFNVRLKKKFDKYHPKVDEKSRAGYLRKVDFQLYKTAIVNYLATDKSGYNTVMKMFKYDPEVAPINCWKNEQTGEFKVVTAGAALNVVEQTKNSVENFLNNRKEEKQENVITKGQKPTM